jgi:hypothetical protein
MVGETTKDSYNQSYWKKNKEKILAKRKERYRTDPEYRTKILKQSRERSKSDRGDIKRKVGRAKLPKAYSFGDAEVAMFSIFFLAQKVSRSIQACRKWEKNGTLPPTPFRKKGVRLYTAEMIEAVASVVNSFGTVRLPNDENEKIFNEIVEKWHELGVYDAQLTSH